jgi:hypothetical protein
MLIPSNRWSDSNLTEQEQQDKQYTYSKEQFLDYFRQIMILDNVDENMIKNHLNVSDIVAKSLFRHLIILRDARRKEALVSLKNKKEKKKELLKKLIVRKNGRTWKEIAEILNVTPQYLRILRKEIEFENKNSQFLNTISNIKDRLNRFTETKDLIKEIGFTNIKKYQLGNYRKIKSLMNKLNNPNSLFQYFNDNIILILDMFPFYKNGTLQQYITSETENLDFNFDKSSSGYEERSYHTVKFIEKIQDDVTICEFIEKEMS